MTNTKTTKRALLFSCLSMLLCISMLVGTTFAWFTDTATTGVNTIVAGNLDIELSYKNANDTTFAPVSAETKDLFVDANGKAMLWEPGAVSVCYFKIDNLGSLALQYKMKVSYKDTVTYGDVKLSDALKTAVVALNNETDTLDRAAAVAAAEAADATSIFDYTVADVEMASKATEYFALVVYMPTTVDNTYNLPAGARALEIQLGIDLVATQVSAETDSYGDDYDEFADYPNFPERVFVAATLPYTNSEKMVVEDYEEGYWIAIPAGAITPHADNLNPTNVIVSFNKEAGANNVKFTFAIEDELGNPLTLSKAATIDTYLGLGLTDVACANTTVKYTESNGQIRITTAEAGSYVVTYNNPNVTVVNNADEFISAFETLATKPGHTISLANDIDMSNKTWTGVNNLSFTLLGNGHTISNITNNGDYSNNHGSAALVNYLGAGNSVVVKNLTLDTINIGNNTSATAVGAIVGYADAAREITVENVTVKNATITSTKYAGGINGYNVGYSNTNDGAVYSLINVTDCSVIDSTITGGGSTGAAIGHASASEFTTTTLERFSVSATDGKTTTISGEDAEHTGVIIGTAHVGKTILKNCSVSGNVVRTDKNSTDLNDTTIIGRFVKGTTGVLTVDETTYPDAFSSAN